MQNVLVLGGAYAGAHVYQLLANGLGDDYRVVLIDRNTHANHLYTFARYSVLPGHEHKAFIPYKGVLHPVKASDPDPPPSPHHLILHAKIVNLSPHEVTIDREFPELGFDSPVIPYTFAVYCLGNHLPASIDFWDRNVNAIVQNPSHSGDEGEDRVNKKGERKTYDGTKKEGIEWFQKCQERVHASDSILCVGGGALGIQFATDVKTVYPEKQVTLLHSRTRLLPRFAYELHIEVMKSVEDLGIELILGERLDLSSTLPENAKYNDRGQRIVQTENGREVAADLILLCTGQLPNTELLASMAPQSVDPKTGLAYVLPTMQLGIILPTEEPKVPEVQSVPTLELELKKLELSEEDHRPSSSDSPNSPSSPSSDNASPPKFHLELPEPGRIKLKDLAATPYGHIFVAGDCADAFGALKAGHTAFWQAETCSRNIIRLATRESRSEFGNEGEKVDTGGEKGLEAESENADQKDGDGDGDGDGDDDFELETYIPGPPAIKISLGVGRTSAYQINGMVGRKDVPEEDDLDAAHAWAFFGIQDAKPEDMYQ